MYIQIKIPNHHFYKEGEISIFDDEDNELMYKTHPDPSLLMKKKLTNERFIIEDQGLVGKWLIYIIRERHDLRNKNLSMIIDNAE